MAFILLPPEGRLLLTGPAGSGKTNLLLLRAQFIAGTGQSNVLVISYTRALTRFIRSGIRGRGPIQPEQVRTFHSWAAEHVGHYLHEDIVPEGQQFDEGIRKQTVEQIRRANAKAPSRKLYDGIFVDEAQDFAVEELECLLQLSDKVCVCGDVKQGIYQRDGLDIGARLGLTPHVLDRHYRIGQAIARVADRLLPPDPGEAPLEATANYNPKIQGASSAEMRSCASRDAQFDEMLAAIRLQLTAFHGDSIGIICGRRRTAAEVMERMQDTDLAELCALHTDSDAQFGGETPIHIITMHSAKGTEFRAVHLFGTEELHGHLDNRELAFTAVTRAKTALKAYRTGATNPALEAAFAEPRPGDLGGLFEE
jgi:superfamily I DNA/RNA helicase